MASILLAVSFRGLYMMLFKVSLTEKVSRMPQSFIYSVSILNSVLGGVDTMRNKTDMVPCATPLLRREEKMFKKEQWE